MRARHHHSLCGVVLWALAALLALASDAPVSAVGMQPRGRFFVGSYTRLTLTQASELCKSEGATLPVISNAADQRELMAVITADPTLFVYSDAAVVTYLNAQRQGTCAEAATSPGCEYWMLLASGKAVTVYRGGATVPGAYTNWGGGFPQGHWSHSAVGVRRDGWWVNLSPTVADDLPYTTVCEALPAVAGKKLAWWMVVVPLVAFAVVVGVAVAVCVHVRRRKAKKATAVSVPAEMGSGSRHRDSWQGAGPHKEPGACAGDESAGQVGDGVVCGDRASVSMEGQLLSRRASPPTSEASSAVVGELLEPELEEVFLLLEKVPPYVPGVTAVDNPVLLLLDRTASQLCAPPRIMPIKLLQHMYDVRRSAGEGRRYRGRWNFSSLDASQFNESRLTRRDKLDHIMVRLPPPWNGIPPYFDRHLLEKIEL